MNDVIRQRANGRGVKLWQIAYQLGMNDASFSRKLRRELPEEEQQKIIQLIDQLAEEAKGNG